jgi:hypothetical protein
MAILGSADLAAATATEVYKADQNRTIDQLIICNRNAAGVDLKVWYVPADTIRGDEHATVWGKTLAANSTLYLNEEIKRLALFESIWVESDTASVSVSVIGL